MDRESETLRQAAELIRAGRSQEALPRLLAVVKADPQSEQAWLLLSYAVSEEKQQRDCLQRVLKINPANAEAAARLASLGSSAPQTRLTQLAGSGYASARPAPQRPEFVKAAPFTSIDEEDLLPAPVVEPATLAPAQQPPLAAEVPGPTAAPPPSPTDWLARLNTDYSPPAASGRPGAGTPSPSAPAKQPPAAPAAVRRPAGKRRWSRTMGLAVAALLIVSVLGCGLALVFAVQAYLAQQGAAPAALPTASPVPYPTFPPAWTPTPDKNTPTPTSLPTEAGSVSHATPSPMGMPTATRTPTQPPTPNSTQRAAMDTIQQQVADVRGLAIQGEVPRYLISKYRLELTARGLLIPSAYQSRLKKLVGAYTALGLIKPTYDLVKYALNSQVDNVGGFYVPWTRQLFVVGDKFSGLEHYVFAHEYDHALVDQHFGINQLGLYPECEGDEQRCRAIRALFEGDATLLMSLWWQQYASPQDYADIRNYLPPQQALPEQFPPPFALRDSDLSYKKGLAFVEVLHERGNWAEVNKAYANLPQSTEQILHPDKYLAGEAPVPVSAPPLTETLGAEWQLIDDNVLGEWMTYLVLGFGADVTAQVTETMAADAAAGWGGDHYQIYSSDTLSQTVLAAQWVWDTPKDLKEFRTAIQFHLNERFRGAKVEDRTDGDCWEANNQATCLFVNDQSVLWVLAPNQSILNAVFAQYADMY
jgi:hypothetical protein